MAESDRKLIKNYQRGQVKVITGIVDPLGEVGRCHQETFLFPIATASTDEPERGIVCTKAFRVKSSIFTPSALLAANGSAYVTYSVQKRDGAGGAAVSVAATDTNTAGANVSLAAFTPVTATPTTTDANLVFAVGNVLTFKSVKTSTPTSPIGVMAVTVEYI